MFHFHHPKHHHKETTKGFGSRIPSTLQAVFVASNRGSEVNKAPPEKVASRSFKTLWSRKTVPKAFKTNEVKKPVKSEPVPEVSPQQFLDSQLAARGYVTTCYPTLKTGYYSKPTDLQIASYATHMINLVKYDERDTVKNSLLAGLSPNPCNTYGESLAHSAARRGNAAMLQVMVDCGTDLQIADDYGRTVLHDACWAAEPAFDTIRLILDRDIGMIYLKDARGSRPLDYVKKEHWPQFTHFIESHIDRYWPRDTWAPMSELVMIPPDSRAIPDPPGALSPELAALVASGRMNPQEAAMLKDDDGSGGSDTDEDSTYSESDFSDSDYGSEYDEDNMSFSEADLADMAGILQHRQ